MYTVSKLDNCTGNLSHSLVYKCCTIRYFIGYHREGVMSWISAPFELKNQITKFLSLCVKYRANSLDLRLNFKKIWGIEKQTKGDTTLYA